MRECQKKNVLNHTNIVGEVMHRTILPPSSGHNGHNGLIKFVIVDDDNKPFLSFFSFC